MGFRLLPVVLAFLLLAAHFYRAQDLVLAGLSLLAMALLFVPRPWAARLLQVLLLLGAVEWVRTLLFFVGVRKAAGMPWLRLILILGPVAALTAAAALVFLNAKVRLRFGLGAA